MTQAGQRGPFRGSDGPCENRGVETCGWLNNLEEIEST